MIWLIIVILSQLRSRERLEVRSTPDFDDARTADFDEERTDTRYAVHYFLVLDTVKHL